MFKVKILILFIYASIYLHFTQARFSDADCKKNKTPVVRKITGAEVLFYLDTSESMEKYRQKLEEVYKPILTDVDVNHKNLSKASQVRFQMARIAEGCLYPVVPSNKPIGFLEIKTNEFNKIDKALQALNESFKNAKSGEENAIFTILEALKKFAFQTKGKCGSFCYYHYHVLFTGSGFDNTTTDCNNQTLPDYEFVKTQLLQSDSFHHIVGFFPNETLVNTYAELTTAYNISYCGYTFKEDVNQIVKLQDYLIDCMKKHTKDNFFVPTEPCYWEDPIGYNTLGL